MDRLSPLSTPAATRAVLEAHGLQAKYSLGQNFLVNDDILRKIIDLAQVDDRDVILEVGPGLGTLTIPLLKHAKQVVSVERDPDLPAVLADTLAPWSDHFQLLPMDALAVRATDLEACGLAPLAAEDGTPHKLVANLPYAVAATVVLDYFERFPSLTSATVMVQKEVADRMAATPGTKNYGAYTVKLALQATPVGRFSVGPGNFYPPPRVESAVIRLDRRTLEDDAGEAVGSELRARAALMADAAFASRRKTLANSCKTYFQGRGPAGAAWVPRLAELFERASIDPRRRGETLTLDEFVALGKAFGDLQQDDPSLEFSGR